MHRLAWVLVQLPVYIVSLHSTVANEQFSLGHKEAVYCAGSLAGQGVE
jgi:hypothetical protein